MLPNDDTTNYRFEIDRSAPWPEGKYHSIRLPEGMAGGEAPTFVGSWNWAATPPLAWPREVAPKGDLYFGFYIRHRGSNGKPYVLRNLGGQKMYYLGYGSAADNISFNHIFIRKWGDTLTGGWAAFEPQFREPCSSESHYTDQSTPVGGDDKWHLIEYIILANERTATTYKSNGKTRIFVDGKQVHYDETTTVYCSGHESYIMNWTTINPIYGGGREPVPYDLYVDYGPIKVMGR
jgi:hypothetical protein